MSAILKDCSPSKTITVANLSKINNKQLRHEKLLALAKQNIKNTQRLFYHNKAHGIQLFRITSKLIPLATHNVVDQWDWVNDLRSDLKLLGDFAKKNKFRISAHPDHFTLLNSPKKEILESSIRDLEYHHLILESMGLDYSSKLVIHVGGSYKNKLESIKRFIANHHNIPKHLKQRIVLENDDKTYTSNEVLNICKELQIPMVLDIHHHWCNNDGDDVANYLIDVFNTWKNEPYPPKIHISSPKNEKSFRSHADNIDLHFFLNFLNKAKEINRDFDVMIEAKNKDLALFNLMNELREVDNIKFLGESIIEI